MADLRRQGAVQRHRAVMAERLHNAPYCYPLEWSHVRGDNILDKSGTVKAWLGAKRPCTWNDHLGSISYMSGVLAKGSRRR